VKKINLIKKSEVGMGNRKTMFDCNGLEKERAGQGRKILPSVAAPR
jgi:hypothetical protein